MEFTQRWKISILISAKCLTPSVPFKPYDNLVGSIPCFTLTFVLV